MPSQADKAPVLPHPPFAPLAAFLSYLVPGLGQIVQGRVAKGLLFMACLYTLFFYGLFLGRGHAAVLPGGDSSKDGSNGYHLSNVYLPTAADRERSSNTAANPQVLSGLALDLYNRPQFIGQFWMGVVVWPAIWQYATYDIRQEEHPALGRFMRTPTVEQLNAVHTASDKIIDLGWVCTVIAGVLNILVIYDALAGPAFLTATGTAPGAKTAT